MEAKHRTLQTIYDIVKDKPNPQTYQCTPRQIILRQLLEWDVILEHVNLLAAENLVLIQKIGDGVGVSITEEGLKKVKAFNTTKSS